MGPGQNFLTRVGSVFCGSGRVESAIFLWLAFEFGKFPLKMTNFSILFPSDQKKSLWVGSESTRVEGGSASYLLRVKSKLGSGWVGTHLYCQQRSNCPIFSFKTKNFTCTLWSFFYHLNCSLKLS